MNPDKTLISGGKLRQVGYVEEPFFLKHQEWDRWTLQTHKMICRW